jgi:calcineurin-like phosphoesterase family protein
MIFYIADMHLGHRNILRFDNRPFETVEEMEETIIHNWNGRVTEEDIVYVLGDAFWKSEKDSVRLIQRLNGHKHLIQGNHDRVHGRLRFYWESIEHYAEIKDGNTLIILSHYPILFYRNQHFGAVMLYGHVHNSREWRKIECWKHEQWAMGIPSQLINVGCMMDYMRYTPRTLEELLIANPSMVFRRKHNSHMDAEGDTEEESDLT